MRHQRPILHVGDFSRLFPQLQRSVVRYVEVGLKVGPYQHESGVIIYYLFILRYVEVGLEVGPYQHESGVIIYLFYAMLR